jgi:eukaryotic-like serine/threonine-protein kinase
VTEEQVFLAVLDLPDPAARPAYLDETCGKDGDLRRQVNALLAAHFKSGGFMDVPAVDQVQGGPEPAATEALSGMQDGVPAGHASTTTGGPGPEEEPLTFLAPAKRADSLGRLGHYEALQILGRGGFGIVFRAFDETLQRVVALKVMAPQLAATSPARKRFLREARSSAQVRHENVVQVYEVTEQPLPYLAMEFIPGETLQQKLDRVGPLDVPETLRIGRQIAEGLAAAHATDLIHRDIKPGNVLLEGGQHKVKITDFGLARAADDASISQSGIIAGTPMYMAPEQALGQTLDQRADLFSLGSVLYQMVAGRPPFRANGTLAVLKRVAEDKPRAIREIIPETPQWLCDIIAKLHAKNPDDRYQSAREVADVLADCEAQLKANAKLKDFSRIPRGKQPAARSSGRWKWVAAAAVLLALIALAVQSIWKHATLGQKESGIDPARIHAARPAAPDTVGWLPLFNGKDLTGWKTHPDQPGQWKVEGGVLVGSAVPSYLYSEGGKFRDFHLRVEAKINNGGDSGIFFRAPFATRQIGANQRRLAGGYEVELQANPHYQVRTGSILDAGTDGAPKALWINNQGATSPDEWLTLEIIVQGSHFVSKVNGTTTADCHDPGAHYDEGHFALQVWNPLTTVQFRKIEIKELPATAAALKYGDQEYTNTLGMKLKLIPAGKFTMGSPQEEIDRCLKKFGEGAWEKTNLRSEGPEHPVEITRPFYLGATEVTVGQFRQFVDEEAYQVGDGRWRNPGFDQTDQHPVVFVSWNNAVDFCKWLSKKEGKEYRLPTEAEWEYSCRAGKAGSRYGFGDDDAQLKDYAWFYQNSGGGTHPVGKKKPNAWGLYDMHGNAWEWCQDNYDPDYYKNSPVKDPPGGAGGARAGRGGGWVHGPVLCRSAFRGSLGPDDHRGAGFRVLLVLTPAGALTESVAKNKPAVPAIAPFTDADVQRIAALPAALQVEEVRKELIRRNPRFDGQVEHQIENGVVTKFKIMTDQVTDIAPIRVFSALRWLACPGPDTNGKANGQLEDLTPLEGMNLAALTHLWLENTQVGDAGLAIFKDCKNLQELHLLNTKVTDAGLANFKDCKGLTALNLCATRVSDAGLVHFRDCNALTRLNLGENKTKVSDVGLANFKDCKNLTQLWVQDTQVGDAGLVHFQDCKALADVNLAGTTVSDVGLAHLRHCKDLTNVALDRTRVGDAGLANFKGIPLRTLWIDNTAITDVTPLQGMPLEHMSLTPKNITRGLDILRAMKSLKTIGLRWNQRWPAAEFWERYDRGEFK